MKTKWIVIYTLAMLFVCGAYISRTEAALTLRVEHRTIPVDTFYNGTTLRVHGTVGNGEDIVVKVSSPIEEESFMTKIKSAHLFWMNKDKVSIKGINHVYMLFSSGKLNGIVSDSNRDKYDLGYKAIQNHMVASPGSVSEQLFTEFIKLKERDGMYVVSDGAVTLKATNNGENEFGLSIDLPYQLPQQRYNITVYGLRQGSVVETASEEVEIQPVGFVKDISFMAYNHGGVYGALSVLIALIAGYFVTPFISLIRRLLLWGGSMPIKVLRMFVPVTATVAAGAVRHNADAIGADYSQTIVKDRG
ncbi:MAG: TIGR02186 family protein [Nitrospirae bacterium]|nr:TIGR02186 family protein [Nitrospirota bacterium]